MERIIDFLTFRSINRGKLRNALLFADELIPLALFTFSPFETQPSPLHRGSNLQGQCGSVFSRYRPPPLAITNRVAWEIPREGARANPETRLLHVFSNLR